MSATVTPLYACRCGGPGTLRELCAVDEPTESFTIAICDSCAEKSERFLSRMRPVFQALLTAGIRKDIADDAMSCLMDMLIDAGEDT